MIGTCFSCIGNLSNFYIYLPFTCFFNLNINFDVVPTRRLMARIDKEKNFHLANRNIFRYRVFEQILPFEDERC